MKRKIGLLAVAEPRHGGTFQYTHAMLEALRDAPGIELTLYTPHGNEHYRKYDLPTVEVEQGTRLGWLILAARDILRLPRAELFAREDFLLAPRYSPLLLHTRRPFAFTLHDLQERHYPQYFSLAERLWRRYVYHRAGARARAVCCESRFVRDDIVRFVGVPPEQVHVITAPAVTMAAETVTADRIARLRERHGLRAQYFFYPAQFWPHKNQLRLVEAFAQLAHARPDVDLVLTGAKREQWQTVFNRVASLGLEARVKHIGYVEQDDMPVLYKGALALIVPSLHESVSIPVYEAFQCGTPVAVSNVVALPEQVGDAGLLFDPLSTQSIADAMRTLIDDAALRDRLAAAGRARLVHFGSEQYRARLLALLSELTR